MPQLATTTVPAPLSLDDALSFDELVRIMTAVHAQGGRLNAVFKILGYAKLLEQFTPIEIRDAVFCSGIAGERHSRRVNNMCWSVMKRRPPLRYGQNLSGQTHFL
jgi:hypothetical protein